jgi:hypothetical protein
MASEPAALLESDLALLDRLAARVAELHLEVPAILTLETAKPLTLLASQALIFFEPIALSLFRIPDYRRVAALVERREALDQLVRMIEDKAGRRGVRSNRHPPAPDGPADGSR